MGPAQLLSACETITAGKGNTTPPPPPRARIRAHTLFLSTLSLGAMGDHLCSRVLEHFLGCRHQDSFFWY